MISTAMAASNAFNPTMLSLAMEKLDKLMSIGVEPKMSPNSTMDSGASSDETGLALLPKNTKVVISGNNRTKRALVGQVAVVLRSVGLGGWHVCRLETGEEVKLQRNALSVLEYGPDEPQEASSDEMTEAREPQIEILTRPRIRRPPRSLSPMPGQQQQQLNQCCNSQTAMPLAAEQSDSQPDTAVLGYVQ
eukprot:GHUV01010415.1.p1 GENE.GHUV01010415.1~~GHUV01010415.1.p1  ORF type:complete len:191 (+),score=36.20 GHUV01010415.1:196-768(+)